MSWQTTNSTYGRGSTNNSSQKTTSPQKKGKVSPYSTRSGPLGLCNLGNTCYISAVLQVLFEVITENDFPLNRKGQQEITALFFTLKKSKATNDYKNFKKALEQRVKIVKGYGQQDAHELFVHLLEQLRKENSDKLASGKPDLEYKQAKSVEENWNSFVREMEKIEKSKIISLFYGETLKKYTCPLGHVKYSFERYSNLSLPFPSKPATFLSYFYFSSEPPLDLEDMMDMFLGEEVIDDLICEKCKAKREFKKKAYLYTLPKFLVLHISRFLKGYFSSEKNNREVRYDEYIKVKEESTGKNVEYKLIGIVHHLGTLNRGHYYAQVRIKDEWYQLNDDKVSTTRVQQSNNLSKSVYMLLYQRN